MLRASCPEVTALHLREVSRTTPADPGIANGLKLLHLADAVSSLDPEQLNAARRSLSEQSTAWVAAAIAVASNFQMMNRILDATGVPVNPRLASTGQELGFSEQDWNRKATPDDRDGDGPAAPPKAGSGPQDESAVA